MAQEVSVMERLAENITKENGDLRDKLTESLGQIGTVKAQLEAKDKELKSLTESKELVDKQVSELNEKLNLMNRKLKSYVGIGEATKIEEALKTAKESIISLQKNKMIVESKLKKLGSLEEIEEALIKSEKMVSQYSKLGDVSKIEEDRKKLSSYTKLGSVKEISEALAKSEKFLTELNSKVGNPFKVQEGFKELRGKLKVYEQLGTPDEIKSIFSKTTSMLEGVKKDKIKTKVKELSESFNVPSSTVIKLMEKLGNEKDVRETLGELKENFKQNARYGEGSSYKTKVDIESTTSPNFSLGESLLRRFNK